jgi:hypothetical protein
MHGECVGQLGTFELAPDILLPCPVTETMPTRSQAGCLHFKCGASNSATGCRLLGVLLIVALAPVSSPADAAAHTHTPPSDAPTVVSTPDSLRTAFNASNSIIVITDHLNLSTWHLLWTARREPLMTSSSPPSQLLVRVLPTSLWPVQQEGLVWWPII